MKKILTLVMVLCSTIVVQADPPSYVDATALRAYYYLANDAGNTMPGNQYTGNTTNAPSYNGQYATFNGQTSNPDFINFVLPPLVANGDLNNGFTVSFWVWLTGNQVPFATFFTKWFENKGIIISSYGGTDNRIRVDIGYGTGYNVLAGTQPLVQSSGWTHIAVKVYRLSNGSVDVYLCRNGILESSANFSQGYKDSMYSADIGYDSQIAGRAYSGDMKHLAIWTKTIPNCEVAKMAVQGNYFSSQPSSITTDVGQTATFSLTSNMANFDPYYTWVNQDNVQMTTWQQGGNSSSLSLSPPLMGGTTYKCILGLATLGSNPNCLVYSNPVTLTVTCNSFPAPIITGPSSVTVGQQGTFNISSGSGYSYGWWTTGANANTISGSNTPNFTCQFTETGTTNIFSHCVYGSCDKSSLAKVVTVSSTTAVGDEIEEGVVGVFPNPASEQLVIKISPSQVNKPYKLTNQLGQTVLEGTFQAMQTSLNVEHLESGMYWITSGETRQSVMVRN